MPSLLVLDGQKVTEAERAQARASFSTSSNGGAADDSSLASPSQAPVTATGAEVGIFGEELNEQLKVQEQITAKRREEEERRQRDKVAIAAMKNSERVQPQPTWLSNPVPASGSPPIVQSTNSAKPPAPKSVPPTTALMSEPPPSVAAQVGLSGAVIPKSRPVVSAPSPQHGDFDELELGIERKLVGLSKASAPRPSSPASVTKPRQATFDADSIFSGSPTSSSPSSHSSKAQKDIFGGGAW